MAKILFLIGLFGLCMPSVLGAQGAFTTGGELFLSLNVVSSPGDSLTIDRDGNWVYRSSSSSGTGIVDGLDGQGRPVTRRSGSNFLPLQVFRSLPTPETLLFDLANWRVADGLTATTTAAAAVTGHTANSLTLTFNASLTGLLGRNLLLFFRPTAFVPTFSVSLAEALPDAQNLEINITDTGGFAVDRITVDFGTDQNELDQQVVVSGSFGRSRQNVALPDLQDGVTYSYIVSLRNAVGTSGTLVASFTFTAAPSNPVFEVAVLPVSENRASTAVSITDTRGFPVNRILFEWGSSASVLNNQWEATGAFLAETITREIGPLVKGQDYFYRATLTNSFGSSEVQEGSFTFSTQDFEPVLQVSFSVASFSSLSSSVEILDARGLTVDRLLFRWGRSAQNLANAWEATGPLGAETVTRFLEGLADGETLFYEVTTESVFGTSTPLTGSTIFRTAAITPLYSVSIGPDARSSTTATVNIQSTLGIPVEQVEFRWGASANSLVNRWTANGPFNETSIARTLENLTDRTTYFYAVRLTNSFGQTPELRGDFTFVSTAVESNLILNLLPLTFNSASFRVDLLNNADSPVERVDLRWGLSPDNLSNAVAQNGPFPDDSTAFILENLQSGQRIFYSVQSTNSTGLSPEVTGDFLFEPVALVDASLQLAPYRQNTLLAEVQITDTRGLAVEEIELRWGLFAANPTETERLAGSFSEETVRIELPGLVVGQSYSFELAFRNALGWTEPLTAQLVYQQNGGGNWALSFLACPPSDDAASAAPNLDASPLCLPASCTADFSQTCWALPFLSPAQTIDQADWRTDADGSLLIFLPARQAVRGDSWFLPDSLEPAPVLNLDTLDPSLRWWLNGTEIDPRRIDILLQAKPGWNRLSFTAFSESQRLLELPYPFAAGTIRNEAPGRLETLFRVGNIETNGEIQQDWWDDRPSPAGNNLNIIAFPFVFHVEHGWLYLLPYATTIDNLWYYDYSLRQWLWTSAIYFPFIWNPTESSWMFYDGHADLPFYTVLNTGRTFVSPYLLSFPGG